MFNIRLADLTISIKNDELRDFFKDYLTNENPIFNVEASLNDIDYERSKINFNTSDLELTKLAIYRKISEFLPNFDGFLIHGSALYIGESKAVLLAGHSGAGKSTHARLLREYYNATMINDDKPLIRVINNIPYIYGTPYNGKHHLSNNIKKELRTIIFIKQNTVNDINLMSKDDSFNKLFTQVYRPHNKEALKRSVELIGITNNYVDTYLLDCDISKEATDLTYKVINK